MRCRGPVSHGVCHPPHRHSASKRGHDSFGRGLPDFGMDEYRESAMQDEREQALHYHLGERPGKIEVIPSKPCQTQRDLSLAYTPGVAIPCLEIQKNPHEAFKYTARGNLVAVVSNGTAVLGLGDIGALAGKPVMEGKAVLFKRFADVDVFDLEINSHDPNDVIKVCQLLEPTFGGINLEDIKAPECFYIEDTLKKTLKIPVFHDDQHGTAIISGAALLNALEIAGKDIGKVRVVVNGAGASGTACPKGQDIHSGIVNTSQDHDRSSRLAHQLSGSGL